VLGVLSIVGEQRHAERLAVLLEPRAQPGIFSAVLQQPDHDRGVDDTHLSAVGLDERSKVRRVGLDAVSTCDPLKDLGQSGSAAELGCAPDRVRLA